MLLPLNSCRLPPTCAQHGRQQRRRQLLHRGVREHKRHPQLVGAVDLPSHEAQSREAYTRAGAAALAAGCCTLCGRRCRHALLLLCCWLLLPALWLHPCLLRLLLPCLLQNAHRHSFSLCLLRWALQRPCRLQDGQAAFKRAPAATRLILQLAAQHLGSLHQGCCLGGLAGARGVDGSKVPGVSSDMHPTSLSHASVAMHGC